MTINMFRPTGFKARKVFVGPTRTDTWKEPCYWFIFNIRKFY